MQHHLVQRGKLRLIVERAVHQHALFQVIIAGQQPGQHRLRLGKLAIRQIPQMPAVDAPYRAGRVQLVHGAQQRAVAAEHQQHVRALGPRSQQHRVPILTQKMPGALAQRQRGRIRTVGIQQKLHTAPRYP